MSTRCLCKTCTRFHQEVTESLPWEAAVGEGIGRFPLRRDSSENCLSLPWPGRGGCDPSPGPPCGAPAAPSGAPAVPVQRRAWLSLRVGSCRTAEGTLLSQPRLRPACRCSWVLLACAAGLFHSFHHLIFVSEEMEVIKGSGDCPVNAGSRQA